MKRFSVVFASEARGAGESHGPELVLGQVGFGYWGPNLARCFSRLQGVRLKYICDTDAGNLKRAGALYDGVLLTSDATRVIDDEEVGAVVVATSAASHYDLARAALLAGKHVFVEKPLSLKLEQGKELAGICENGTVLFVGHVFLYHPAVRFIKGYIDSGLAGEVICLHSRRLNLGRARRDENCLWSLAPHDVSMMLYLLGEEPESVASSGISYLRKGLEDMAFLTMYFGHGVMGQVHVSWLDPVKVRSLMVVGSERTLVFDDMSQDAKVKIFEGEPYAVGGGGTDGYRVEPRSGHLPFEAPSIPTEEPLLAECRHFRDCVMGGLRPVTDGSEGLAVLRVLEAATASLKRGGTRVRA